ncbi:MAG: hypothetical protein ACE5GW_12440 [Planctomycetota bacterium]
MRRLRRVEPVVLGRRVCGRLAGLLLVLLLAPGCVQLKDMKIASAGADYWRADLDGDVQFSEGGLQGTRIDLSSELNLDDREEVVVYRGTAQLLGTTLEGRYIDLTYKGSTTSTQPINFEGVSFPAGSDLVGRLDATLFTAHSRFGAFGFLPVAVGWIVGVDYVKVDASLASSAPTSQSASKAIEEYIPVVGVTGSFNFPLGEYHLFADAEISGLWLSYGGLDGTFIDAAGRAGIKFEEWLSLGVGYRLLELDFEDDNNNEANLSIGGPFVFGEIVF